MAAEQNFHMTPEEFRQHGRMVIDWIADYYEQVEKYPVLSTAKPGQIRAGLPSNPPQHGEPFEAILGDMESLIMPGITHWQSPNWFSYCPANSSGPSLLGEMAAAVAHEIRNPLIAVGELPDGSSRIAHTADRIEITIPTGVRGPVAVPLRIPSSSTPSPRRSLPPTRPSRWPAPRCRSSEGTA